MIINWPLLWIGTIIFGIAYVRMRDRVSIENRSRIEITIMILTMVFLLISIGLQIENRKNITEDVNDCILYYRLYTAVNDTAFNFIQNCNDNLDSLKMLQIRESGIKWKYEMADQGFTFYQNKTWEIDKVLAG